VSAASDLLSSYQHIIESLTLVTGAKGIFDVEVDGEMLYSKHATTRHAQPGEILELFRDRYAQGVTPYGA
jgi:predicted Rdx family selenoprotein